MSETAKRFHLLNQRGEKRGWVVDSEHLWKPKIMIRPLKWKNIHLSSFRKARDQEFHGIAKQNHRKIDLYFNSRPSTIINLQQHPFHLTSLFRTWTFNILQQYRGFHYHGGTPKSSFVMVFSLYIIQPWGYPHDNGNPHININRLLNILLNKLNRKSRVKESAHQSKSDGQIFDHLQGCTQVSVLFKRVSGHLLGEKYLLMNQFGPCVMESFPQKDPGWMGCFHKWGVARGPHHPLENRIGSYPIQWVYGYFPYP